MSAYLLPQLQRLDLKCMYFFNDNHDREDGGQKIHYYFGEAKKLFTFMKGTRRFKRASSIDGCRTEFPNQKKRKRKRDLMPVPRTLQLSEEHKFAPINTPKHQLPILIVKCG